MRALLSFPLDDDDERAFGARRRDYAME